MTELISNLRSLILQLVVLAVVFDGNLTNCFGQNEFDRNTGAIAKLDSIEPVAEFQLTGRNSSTARWGAMLSLDAKRLVTWEKKSHHAFLSSTSWRENVKLWDIAAERLISSLESDEVAAGDFAFSTSGEQFAYFDDQHLFVVNTDSGEKIAKVKMPGIFRVQFLANHPRLLVFSFVDGEPKLGTKNEIRVQQLGTETWTHIPMSCGVIKSEMSPRRYRSLTKGGCGSKEKIVPSFVGIWNPIRKLSGSNQLLRI